MFKDVQIIITNMARTAKIGLRYSKTTPKPRSTYKEVRVQNPRRGLENLEVFHMLFGVFWDPWVPEKV